MSVAIKAEVKVAPELFSLIKSAIRGGMEDGCNAVAQGIRTGAVYLLQQRIINKDKSTGRLASAILVLDANPGMPGYYRKDVHVNTNTAPYANWVEWGRYTAYGLPYSKVTGAKAKDFRQSSFAGHRFLTDSVEIFKSSGNATQMVAEAIVNSLKRTSSGFNFKDIK
jgi:hypothetical protein